MEPNPLRRTLGLLAGGLGGAGILSALILGGRAQLFLELGLLTLLAPGFGAQWVRGPAALRRLEVLAVQPWRGELTRLGLVAGTLAAGLLAGGTGALIAGSSFGAVLATRVVLLAWACLCLALGLGLGRTLLATGIALFAGLGIVTAAPLFALFPGRAWVVDGVLAASPLVAVFDAVGQDLLRSEPFYWLSPAATLPGARAPWSGVALGNMLAASACYILHRLRSPMRLLGE